MLATIIIPARYGSTRFPGKPLALLKGKTVLQRVVAVAKKAASQIGNVDVIVATDHPEILEHAQTLSVKTIMTPPDCLTGTDRVLTAIQNLTYEPTRIINLQGDAPFTPPEFIVSLINELIKPSVDMATPVVQLSWEELDELRDHKKRSPFSGTTAVLNQYNHAVWFSKNIIPAIRNEETLRKEMPLSPVHQHIGLYGYKLAMLQKMASLEEGYYERIEGLEQLRILEQGFTIHAVKVKKAHAFVATGIDTQEDLKQAEKIIDKFGDF